MKKHQWVPVHRHTNPLDGGALHGGGIVDEEDTGGGCDCPPLFPYQRVGAPALVQNKLHASAGTDGTITLDAVPGVGNLLVAVVGWRSADTPPSILTGFTEVVDVQPNLSGGHACVYVAWRIAQSTDTATFIHATTASKDSVIDVSEWSGAWSSPVDVYATGTGGGVTPSVTITPTAGESALIIGGAVNANGNTPHDTAYVAGSGYTLLGQSDTPGGSPEVGAVYKSVASTTGSYSPTMTATAGFGGGADSYWAEIAVAFKQDASSSPPAAGQWHGISPPELVTLTAGAGTTAFPFADGSLRVFYDIVEQTAAIVSYNGATGAFTMPSQPPLGTQVFVQYQGR